MNMKLSYRDKIIFIVAIVIIILVAGFFILIRPKFAEIDTAKAAYEKKQQEQTDIDTKIGTLPSIIENMKTAAKEVGEQQELFFTEQDPYLNEDYVRAMLNDLGIHIKAMDTQYAVSGNIRRFVNDEGHILTYDNKMNADLYYELPQEVWDKYNKVAATAYPAAMIGVTNMTVTFNSDIDLSDAWAFVDRVAEDDMAIILNTIESGDISSIDDEGLEIEATITMYSIFPLNVDKVLEENADWQQYMNAAPAGNEAA